MRFRSGWPGGLPAVIVKETHTVSTMTDDGNHADSSSKEASLSSREALVAAAAEMGRRAAREGVALTSQDGLFGVLMKNTLEAAMKAELTDHLRYEKYSASGVGSGNSRGRITPK